MSAILRVSEVESRAIRADLTHLLSPQMGKDIVWFLKRWAKTYLLVDEKLYDQVRMWHRLTGFAFMRMGVREMKTIFLVIFLSACE